MSEIISLGIRHADRVFPRQVGAEKLFTSGVFPPQTHEPSFHRKTVRQTQMKGQSPDTCPVLLRAVTATKESLRNRHRPEELIETQRLNTMQGPAWDAGTREELLGKPWRDPSPVPSVGNEQ